MAHGRDPLALVGAGEAQHVPGVVEADDVSQIAVSQRLCAQRITRHQDNLAQFILDDDGSGDTFFWCHFLFPLSMFSVTC